MLADPEAQEWMVNGPRRIFRDTGERIERVTDIAFTDDRQLRAFLERLLETGRRQTPRPDHPARSKRASPTAPGSPRRSRRVSSNGHVICSIRRFRLERQLAHRPRQQLGFLSEQAADFLAACVRAGKNIVVAGRVSSGKTTLLNALGRAIPASERVVVCESSAELQLPRVLANCVGYEARPGSIDGLPAGHPRRPRLRRAADEPRPDHRRRVPRPRNDGDALGVRDRPRRHDRVHGESAEHALRNLVRFALTSGARIEPEQALDWLREIDLVVHCDRPRTYNNGERSFLPRHVDEIVEVAGIEGNRPTLNPLFEGAGADLRWLGVRPRFLTELATPASRPPHETNRHSSPRDPARRRLRRRLAPEQHNGAAVGAERDDHGAPSDDVDATRLDAEHARDASRGCPRGASTRTTSSRSTCSGQIDVPSQRDSLDARTGTRRYAASAAATTEQRQFASG